MDARGVELHSLQGIKHCWQFLVLDIDKTQGLFGSFDRVGGHGRHPIAHEAHHLPAEDGHVADLFAHEVAWDLLAGDDGSYSRYLAGSGGVNAKDASMRVGAAEDFAPE